MKLNKTCEFCRNEFEVILSKSRLASGNRGRFCNIGCYHTWQKKQAIEKTEKKCGICKEVKQLSRFYKNKASYDGYHSNCKECGRKAAKEYYQNNKESNKEKFLEIAKKSARKRRQELVKVITGKFSLKCPDCGIEGPFCIYDLHHIDTRNKELSISKIGYVNSKVLEELDKVILICSNCHRIRHRRDI